MDNSTIPLSRLFEMNDENCCMNHCFRKFEQKELDYLQFSIRVIDNESRSSFIAGYITDIRGIGARKGQ